MRGTPVLLLKAAPRKSRSACPRASTRGLHICCTVLMDARRASDTTTGASAALTPAAAALAKESPSFRALAARVDAGTLRIVFVLGLPRGGTTATERFLYETLPFDAQVNEPSLLGLPDGASRIEPVFRAVLAAAADATTILVKEVANKVLPTAIELWSLIARWWVIVVRQPRLQLESRLVSMLDRVDSGALAPFFTPEDSAIDGRCVCAPPWHETWARMKSRRDYACLDEGAARLCLLHPFCLWPDVQHAILGRVACSEMVELGTLDDRDGRNILEWRLGWSALVKHLDVLATLTAPPDTTIVDFSSVQADGGFSLREKLHLSVFAGATRVPARRPFEWCAHRDRWDDDNWERWYGAPCFAEARSAAIDRPRKTPVPASLLPPFLRAALADASKTWAALVLMDARALPPVAAPGVDAVHDWACAAYGRADDLLAEAERVVVESAVLTPSRSPPPPPESPVAVTV